MFYGMLTVFTIMIVRSRVYDIARCVYQSLWRFFSSAWGATDVVVAERPPQAAHRIEAATSR